MYTFDRNILSSHIKDTFPENGQIYRIFLLEVH